VRQSQEMICGGRYLSSDDAIRVFAAGTLTNDLRIEVTWRGGKRSVVASAQPNRIYEIDEMDSTASGLGSNVMKKLGNPSGAPVETGLASFG